MGLIDEGAVFLVTGATGSVGFEVAAQAAEAGAVVAVHGSGDQTVAGAIDRLKLRVPGARLIPAPGDFREPGGAEAVVRRAAAEAGRLDAVVHCAIAATGRSVTGPFRQTEPADYGLLAASILGVFEQVCFAALPELARQGGTIIGFASDAGRFAAPRQAVLGAAYGGVMTFVRNLAVETGKDRVRVHCISPSFIAETRIFDRFIESGGGRAETALARAGLGLPTPADIAPLVLFLCGPGARRITGQVISVNGGLHA